MRRESAILKPCTGALASKNCAPSVLPTSRRVTPRPATAMSATNIQRMGASFLCRMMSASFSSHGSKYSLSCSRSVCFAEGGDISMRMAGMKVISTVSAARIPKAVHRPKFLMVGNPKAASDPKLSEAIKPAASMTTPTFMVASMTATRLCSLGDSSGLDALLRANSS